MSLARSSLLMVALALLPPVSGQTPVKNADVVPAIAADSRKTFDETLAKLAATMESTCESAAKELSTKAELLKSAKAATAGIYREKLEAHLKTATDQSDLDVALIIKKELEGFANSAATKLPEKVRADRREYEKQIGDLTAAHESGAVKVHDKAVSAARSEYESKARDAQKTLLSQLTILEKSETKANKLDSALAVREYYNRVRVMDLKAPPMVRAAALAPAFENTLPEYRGRFGANRSVLAKTGGGNDASELAVARGLAWLAKQQRANGSWVYEGTSAGDTCASTAMALLPFLGAGQTHLAAKGNLYSQEVSKGVDYLISLQKPGVGDFRTSSNMYSHAIAALSLCELYGMTGDKKLLTPAKSATNYIVKGQGATGSWGYKASTDGDTSIVGWQIQALRSASLTKDIPVPKATFTKAGKFLDSVGDGVNYGYREGPGARGTALSAIGSLSRRSTDQWESNNPKLKECVEGLLARSSPEEKRFNMYYYYYATGLVHYHQGDAWKQTWNPKMRDMLVKMQLWPEKPTETRGSWDKDMGMIGSHCGRLGTTCLSLLVLEVYYRDPTAEAMKAIEAEKK